MRNLHKFYYKDYFDLGKDENGKSKFEYIFDKNPKGKAELVAAKNKLLTGFSFSDKNHDPYIIIKNPICNNSNSIRANVLYQGLVTGVGINHEAKIEGEFKLGVHFDYTYGMPVVYGSSVKGVLRNAFILKQEKGKILEYDPYFLKKITNFQWKQKEIETLFNDIFEGKNANGPKSIYDRDIFFDAVITKADSKGRILCSGSITPHGNDELKNPTTLTFLKIAPGCTMEFRFKLVDSKIDGKCFTVGQKKELFETIIKTVGVGAKTNVGYGQFQ